MNTFNQKISQNHRTYPARRKPADLFLKRVRHVFWAEQTLQEILPRLAKAAWSRELTSTFDLHAAQTEEHIKKLKPIFYMLGERPEPRSWQVIVRLVDEYYNVLINPEADPKDHELKLIKTSRKLERLIIAIYNSLLRIAKDLAFTEAENVLKSIIEQEKARFSVLLMMDKELL